jgi:hypothetical protein
VGLERGASARLRMVMSAVRSKTWYRDSIWAENLLDGSWCNKHLLTSAAGIHCIVLLAYTLPVPLPVTLCSPHARHLSACPATLLEVASHIRRHCAKFGSLMWWGPYFTSGK